MNLFEIAAKLTLDSSEYDEGLEKSEKKATGFGSKLGGFVKGVAKAGAAAVAAAGTAVGAIVKQSVDAYGEYQQLVGGAELMFGADAYQTVAENAKNAFKTVQMSASDYLRQVNGFATGLKTALGGDSQAAANLAHNIVKAEADIIAATGNSAENVQNAFNGLMRNNFTMLDNLQIGIKPTKEGMQEVIDKVNEWNAANGRMTDYQMGNLADMQSALVDYIDMVGYAGYAGMEAGDTLQGSFASAKAAWDNLLVGMSDDNADLGQLVDNLIQSAGGAIGNMLPLIQNAITGVGTMVKSLVPALADFVEPLISDTLPALLDAALALVEGLGGALLDNADILIQDILDLMLEVINHIADGNVIGKIINAAFTLINTLGTWLAEYSGVLIQKAVEIIVQLAMALTNPESITSLIDTALVLIMSLVDGLIEALPTLIEAAPVIVQNLVDSIVAAVPLLIEAALSLINALVGALLDNIYPILQAGVQILIAVMNGIVSILPELVPLAFQIIMTIITALIEHLPDFVSSGIDFVMSLIDGIVSYYSNLAQAGIQLVINLIDAIVNAAKGLIDAGRQMVEKVKDGFRQKIEDAKNWGRDLIQNFIGGIQEKWNALKEKVAGVANTVKSFLGFSEPEEGPLSDFHTYAPDMMDLFAKGIRDNTDVVRNQLAESFAFDDLMHPELTVTHTETSGGVTQEEILADLRSVLARLQAIEPGTLVGMIAPDMDAALGNRYTAAQRRLA